MASYVFAAGTPFTIYSARFQSFQSTGTLSSDRTFSDGDTGDTDFQFLENLSFSDASGGSGGAQFNGTYSIGGIEYPYIFMGGDSVVLYGIALSSETYPNTSSLGTIDRSGFTTCFLAGSLIATPSGEAKVEDLAIGDEIKTQDGHSVPVTWIGRQTVHKLFSGARSQPVRIRARALGNDLPHTDLTVTADHGMVIDGYVINASALVNGDTIDFVPMDELKDSFTVYHIETEHHDVILANGAPSETFIDAAGRSAFDNHAEYLDLYGAERIIPEMDRPRISSRRLVPQSIKSKLDQPGKGLPSRHNRLIA